jgi:hypothetical protein
MSVSEDIRHRLSLWCAARIPDAERAHRQIAYTVEGGHVTIVDRRAPTRPELGTEWSSTPLARLHTDGDGRWTLHRPAAGRWVRHADGADPIALLDAVT